MDEMIHCLERALREFDEKKTIVPQRDGFEYDQPDVGLLEWMPVLQVGEKATIKVVGYNPTNPVLRSLPTIVSTVGTYDTASGHLIALADATFLTALRTGAASAIASKIMGRPDSRIIGLIGCGAQAVTQLHALSRVFDIESVLNYDIDSSVSESLRSRVAFTELDVKTAALGEILEKSDILCTATSVEKGEGPVFHEADYRPWLHINAVGSDFPGKFEIPTSLLKRSLVCPDFLDQAVKEGECQHLHRDEIGPDLVRLVKERDRHRSVQDKLTVFDSTGWAFEDQIALDILIDHARELGLGSLVQVESCSIDPRNPYDFLNASPDKVTTEDTYYRGGS